MYHFRDLLRIFEAGSTPEFVTVLVETGRCIYDWGYDEVWVWRGDKLDPEEGNGFHMDGERLQVFMSKAFEKHNWPTSAGFVVDLLACGLDVEIATSKLLDSSLLARMAEAAKQQNPDGEIKPLRQFACTYSKTTFVKETYDVDEIIFQVGDRVTCPSEFGEEELIVKAVVPVSPGEERLVGHSQWVIAEIGGVALPSKSGYYFTKKKTSSN